MISFEILPVEELSFKAPGEVGTGYRLSHIPLPLPTTIAGALAAIGWIRDPNCSRDAYNRVDRVKRCLGSLGFRLSSIRGPYLLSAGNSDGYYIWSSNRLIRLDVEMVSRWIRRQEEGATPGKRSVRDFERKDYERLFYKIVSSHRFFVRLQRGKKVVDEARGALFSLPFVGYKREDRIVFDVFGEGSLPDKFFVRLGGEQRIAVIEKSSKGMFSFLREIWGEKKGGRSVVVVATPILADFCQDDPLDCIKKLFEKNDLIEFRSGLVEIFSVHPYIRPVITPLYPGFDEIRRVKEPFYLALLPGAAVVGDVESWSKLYQDGIGKYRELGYGTLVPIPYEK